MAITAFQSRILLDTGLSMGDEGKGRVIPEVIQELRETTSDDQPVGVVIKVNGGANSGHTCGGLKLNLFPAGVIRDDVPVLAIGSGVVADPHKFHWEAAYIESRGFSVYDRLLIDERTMVSDLGHRLLDLAWEAYRVETLGETPRGSTGRGISPAYSDETACFPITYAAFLENKADFARVFSARLERACRTIQHVCGISPEQWFGFFDTLSTAEERAHQAMIDEGLIARETFAFKRFCGAEPFTLKLEDLVDAYWQAGTALRERIGDVREMLLATLRRGRYILGEFGQAYWLDKRFGFAPNVTASHTLPAEFFLSAGLPVQPVHVIGVCKAYDTKVGTHTFVTQFPDGHPLGERLKKLEFGATTGRQRMVGWFDAVEKGDSLRYGGCDDLAINKLDALSTGEDWDGDLFICSAYRDVDGTLLRHVPRSSAVHRRVQPVFLQTPGWSEDIRSVRHFTGLPKNAQRYIALMIKATLDCAYGPLADWPTNLPNLRYIGVGPNPDEIIRDLPSTRDLLEYA
ncbi:MAG: adenylosuccinate synthetase [Opitutales bacterium]|nr:adenylosuccinate synthetase [Opitutales bacterium]